VAGGSPTSVPGWSSGRCSACDSLRHLAGTGLPLRARPAVISGRLTRGCTPIRAGTLAGGLVALEAELGWFESQAKRRGLALSSDRQPATEAYRLALAKLLEDGFEPAITALWALERAYLEAWRGAAPGAPAYGEFVAHWTMPEFGEYVAELETAAGEGREAEDAFLEVCRLERGFWDMAWSAP